MKQSIVDRMKNKPNEFNRNLEEYIACINVDSGSISTILNDDKLASNYKVKQRL